MRVSSLKSGVFDAPYSHVSGYQLRDPLAAYRTGLMLFAPKFPTLARLKATPSKSVLDRGFFFPVSTP